jgi:translation initiation factor 2 subunit 2
MSIFDDTPEFEDGDGMVVSGNNQAAAEEDAELALFKASLGKKKKKKKKKKAVKAADTTDNKQAWLGSDRDYTYTEMLDLVFAQLHAKNPGLSVRKKHSMPPPQVVRAGARKTMWSNFAQICQVMHRQQSHVMAFMLAELGTEGSLDANQRLIVKLRYAPQRSHTIESLLKKYIVEYVTCHMCRNPSTTLTRDSMTRLYFLKCESCGSHRSVSHVGQGFHATMRGERRAARAAATN